MQWLTAMAAFVLSGSVLYGNCVLCEQINERNRNTPPPEQEFYEDFLEAQKAEGNNPPGTIQFVDEATESGNSVD